MEYLPPPLLQLEAALSTIPSVLQFLASTCVVVLRDEMSFQIEIRSSLSRNLLFFLSSNELAHSPSDT